MSARLLVVTGATATGKTQAALALAQRFDGELVGADSVQIYRGFDIGSGKATPAELQGIPHHLIDVLSPLENLDAAQYAALADSAIESIHARGKQPVVVGGTGLWIRALLRGLMPLPPSNPLLRRTLTDEAAALGTPALHARLKAIDPLAAEQIHPNDTVRVTRALEIFAQTGRPAGELRKEHALGTPRYPTWAVVLDLDRNLADQAIEARIDSMLARGWMEETRQLVETWPSARALGSVGYRELATAVRGEHTLPEARIDAIRATRTYARRQRTWCKSEPGMNLHTTARALIEGEHDEAIRAFLSSSD